MKRSELAGIIAGIPSVTEAERARVRELVNYVAKLTIAELVLEFPAVKRWSVIAERKTLEFWETEVSGVHR